jgi:hypothetical protein
MCNGTTCTSGPAARHDAKLFDDNGELVLNTSAGRPGRPRTIAALSARWPRRPARRPPMATPFRGYWSLRKSAASSMGMALSCSTSSPMSVGRSWVGVRTAVRRSGRDKLALRPDQAERCSLDDVVLEHALAALCGYRFGLTRPACHQGGLMIKLASRPCR